MERLKKKITSKEFDKRFDNGEDTGDILDVKQTMAAVNSMQTQSVKSGADRMSLDEINKETNIQRRSRRHRILRSLS